MNLRTLLLLISFLGLLRRDVTMEILLFTLEMEQSWVDILPKDVLIRLLMICLLFIHHLYKIFQNCRAGIFYGFATLSGKEKLFDNDCLTKPYLVTSSCTAFEVKYLYEIVLNCFYR